MKTSIYYLLSILSILTSALYHFLYYQPIKQEIFFDSNVSVCNNNICLYRVNNGIGRSFHSNLWNIPIFKKNIQPIVHKIDSVFDWNYQKTEELQGIKNHRSAKGEAARFVFEKIDKNAIEKIKAAHDSVLLALQHFTLIDSIKKIDISAKVNNVYEEKFEEKMKNLENASAFEQQIWINLDKNYLLQLQNGLYQDILEFVAPKYKKDIFYKIFAKARSYITDEYKLNQPFHIYFRTRAVIKSIENSKISFWDNNRLLSPKNEYTATKQPKNKTIDYNFRTLVQDTIRKISYQDKYYSPY